MSLPPSVAGHGAIHTTPHVMRAALADGGAKSNTNLLRLLQTSLSVRTLLFATLSDQCAVALAQCNRAFSNCMAIAYSIKRTLRWNEAINWDRTVFIRAGDNQDARTSDLLYAGESDSRARSHWKRSASSSGWILAAEAGVTEQDTEYSAFQDVNADCRLRCGRPVRVRLSSEDAGEVMKRGQMECTSPGVIASNYHSITAGHFRTLIVETSWKELSASAGSMPTTSVLATSTAALATSTPFGRPKDSPSESASPIATLLVSLHYHGATYLDSISFTDRRFEFHNEEVERMLISYDEAPHSIQTLWTDAAMENPATAFDLWIHTDHACDICRSDPLCGVRYQRVDGNQDAHWDPDVDPGFDVCLSCLRALSAGMLQGHSADSSDFGRYAPQRPREPEHLPIDLLQHDGAVGCMEEEWSILRRHSLWKIVQHREAGTRAFYELPYHVRPAPPHALASASALGEDTPPHVLLSRIDSRLHDGDWITDDGRDGTRAHSFLLRFDSFLCEYQPALHKQLRSAIRRMLRDWKPKSQAASASSSSATRSMPDVADDDDDFEDYQLSPLLVCLQSLYNMLTTSAIDQSKPHLALVEMMTLSLRAFMAAHSASPPTVVMPASAAVRHLDPADDDPLPGHAPQAQRSDAFFCPLGLPRWCYDDQGDMFPQMTHRNS